MWNWIISLGITGNMAPWLEKELDRYLPGTCAKVTGTDPGTPGYRLWRFKPVGVVSSRKWYHISHGRVEIWEWRGEEWEDVFVRGPGKQAEPWTGKTQKELIGSNVKWKLWQPTPVCNINLITFNFSWLFGIVFFVVIINCNINVCFRSPQRSFQESHLLLWHQSSGADLQPPWAVSLNVQSYKIISVSVESKRKQAFFPVFLTGGDGIRALAG